MTFENGFSIEIGGGLIKVDYKNSWDSYFFEDMEDVEFDTKLEVFSSLCENDLEEISKNCLFIIDVAPVIWGYATMEELIEQNLNRLAA